MFKKRRVSLVLLSLMIGVMGINANAQNPRGALCPDCNEGTMSISYTSYGTWYWYDEVDCEHKSHGVDEIQRRSRIVTWRCSDCGMAQEETGYQTRTVCHGY